MEHAVLFIGKFSTENELYSFYTENLKNIVHRDIPTMGIIFDDFPENSLPAKLNYTIRTSLRGVFDTAFPIGTPWSRNGMK